MVTRKPERVDEPRDPLAGRRRPDAARPRPAPRRGTGASPAVPRRPRRLRLTGRGGILVICAVSFASALLGGLIAQPQAGGVAFTAACVLAALTVRPTDLLSLTVSPPLAYFTAALGAEMLLTLGDTGFARGVAIGMATRLADVAPWLFLGTALVLVIAVFRGLPRNVRAFSDEVNGRRPRAAAPEDRGRPGGA
ncbi:hypothetical protein KUM37_05715 [Streptomonospora sp. NEAU-YY374]|nr:DUF6542 domain-containing protein [Streptomonospora nanhaiensis]MBV2362843.1 hypothetical protein [Streptomonospora nanhaiensis]MBX9387012.1 hypothetical protein [Streptomonospora nanhaiensis]